MSTVLIVVIVIVALVVIGLLLVVVARRNRERQVGKVQAQAMHDDPARHQETSTAMPLALSVISMLPRVAFE